MSTLHERFVDMDARTRRKCQGLYWTPTAFPAGHDRVSCIHPSFGRHSTGVGYLGKTACFKKYWGWGRSPQIPRRKLLLGAVAPPKKRETWQHPRMATKKGMIETRRNHLGQRVAPILSRPPDNTPNVARNRIYLGNIISRITKGGRYYGLHNRDGSSSLYSSNCCGNF